MTVNIERWMSIWNEYAAVIPYGVEDNSIYGWTFADMRIPDFHSWSIEQQRQLIDLINGKCISFFLEHGMNQAVHICCTATTTTELNDKLYDAVAAFVSNRSSMHLTSKRKVSLTS